MNSVYDFHDRVAKPGRWPPAVLWLCSPGASCLIGVALPVDGGYTAH